MVAEIVETCRICRMWTRPAASPMSRSRPATFYYQLVQWDILFHKQYMVSNLIEAIRWSVISVLESIEA